MSAAPPLPAALQPWHAWLAWFDADIAAMVGDWLLRLDPLIGRGVARVQHGAADPEGVEDLRRRGPYERLVLSEWAVADVLPDEFLRRAAHHEHLFLAPRFVERRGDARIVAIFDAGPAQRGASRLLHVAIWILLARRAGSERARYAWGVAHRPGELHDTDDPEALRQLLLARTHQVTTEAHLGAWCAHLAGGECTASERWWLAATHQGTGSFERSVRIRQGFDRQLHVSVDGRHGRRELALDVPRSLCAARMLRGEFVVSPTSPPTASSQALKGRLSLRQPPLFSVDGRHVALPLVGQNQAVMLRIPREGRRRNAAPRYSAWAAGAELISGVITGKEFAGLVTARAGLYFWKIPGFSSVERPPVEEFTVLPGASRWLRCAWLKGEGQTHRVVVLDCAGRLLSWTNASTRPGREAPAYVKADQDVLEMVQIDAQRLVYARYESGHLHVNRMHRDGRIELLTRLAVASQPSQVVFRGHLQGNEWQGGIGLEYRRGQRGGDRSHVYRLYQGVPGDGSSELELNAPQDWKLLGLVPDPHEPERSHLLVMRPDRRTLVAIGGQGQEVLFRTSCDISAASLSHDGRLVALVNLDGQLLILGEGGRQLLMCFNGQREGELDE